MISLSTKGRYATRAMLELALRGGENPVLLRDIAKTQEISEKYLERIMIALVAAGLVRSLRGQNGGFSLLKSPSDIKIIHILQAVEGPVSLVPCVHSPQVCHRSDICVTRDVWLKLKNAVVSVLDGITLENLVDMHRDKQVTTKSQMYCI
jgi:Rrf2 family cysteine metabolism transcriptional repressor